MAACAWETAPSPNYTVNVDKSYPYSEVPYIGQYKLVKIPLGQELIDLVDYWGEGRIQETSECGAAGLPDCYNVNHQSQCISYGPDKGKKIPNRVPVQSYTTCNTSSYIKDDSVKIVTIMGASINSSCSKDITRMVNKEQGKVVVFGFDDTSADIKNLETDLSAKGLIKCSGYELPAALQSLTYFDSIGNINDLELALRQNVIDGNYDVAVDISKAFYISRYASTIHAVVAVLITESNINLFNYAYKLWNSDAQRIVSKYFPVEFKLILNEDNVVILNKNFNQALKLAVVLDSDNDRRAWGDGKDKTSKRVSWKVIPTWKNDRVSFRLLNVDCGMFLKLGWNLYKNSRGAWGAYSSPDDRHFWDLEPVILNGELMFYIINREYRMGLKLDAAADSIGDRELWGHNKDVHHDPGYFGWNIKSWY